MNHLRLLTKSPILTKNFAANVEFITFAKKMTTETEVNVPKYETLAVSVPKPFVFHVELNRPDKRNAMNYEMWIDIKKCFEELSYNADCRTIVLSGSGKLFCAGIDVQSFMNVGSKIAEPIDVARKCNFVFKNITLYQESLTAIEKCMKPVIAAVNGGCIGSGLDMITATDMRYCSKDAWFSVKEVDLGLAPDVGTLQRLPKVVGSTSLVRELCYTARKLTADEAKECGLVNRVYDSKDSLIEGSINIAADIASKSPVAVQTSKRNLIFSQDHSVADGLHHIALLNSTMLQSEDLMAAIIAGMSKETATFSKL